MEADHRGLAAGFGCAYGAVRDGQALDNENIKSRITR